MLFAEEYLIFRTYAKASLSKIHFLCKKTNMCAPQQWLFFAESSELCFLNKDVPENITVFSLFIQSFLHPFAYILVHTCVHTRLCKHTHTHIYIYIYLNYRLIYLMPYQCSCHATHTHTQTHFLYIREMSKLLIAQRYVSMELAKTYKLLNSAYIKQMSKSLKLH